MDGIPIKLGGGGSGTLNMPVVFAAILGGAVIVDYGVKAAKSAFAAAHSNAGTTEAASTGGVTVGTSNVSIAGNADTTAWARAFLQALNVPLTQQNVNNIVAWENAEGGIGHNNPLNTTESEPGDGIWNSVGVKTYPTMQEGLNANVAVITDPNNAKYGYPNIINALKAGNVSTSQFGQIVGATQWGTSPF